MDILASLLVVAMILAGTWQVGGWLSAAAHRAAWRKHRPLLPFSEDEIDSVRLARDALDSVLRHPARPEPRRAVAAAAGLLATVEEPCRDPLVWARHAQDDLTALTGR